MTRRTWRRWHAVSYMGWNVQDCLVHECRAVGADDQTACEADCRGRCDATEAHGVCEDCEWDDWWGGFDDENE